MVRIYHLAAVIIPSSCGLFRACADFCFWAPPDPDSLIGNEEAETVAWCTKPGHGTRIIPGGTLTGVQLLKAPAYILVAGTIIQANVNINPSDGGGEMDPHGADEVCTRLVLLHFTSQSILIVSQRGNPLGSLVYTNAFPSNGGNNNSFQQVIEWHKYVRCCLTCS
jgi:hypothetical protein